MKTKKEDKKQTIRVGIDPGNKGAIAYVLEDGSKRKLVQLYNMPRQKGDYNIPLLAEQIKATHEVFQDKGFELTYQLEKVGLHFRSGRKAAFGFGYSYGLIKGVFHAIGLVTKPITPISWKKRFKIKEKEDAIKVAKRHVKGIASVIKENKRLRSLRLDQAEAILIAIA
jgi:hypothetical protein